MQVILTQDIPKLGKKHDLIIVKEGYGRNYLLPRGLAHIATSSGISLSKKNADARVERVQAMHEKAKEFAQKLRDYTLTMKRKGTKQGNLYGSVSTSDIAQALESELKVHIDADSIQLSKPVKKASSQKVTVQLSPETEGRFTLNVEFDSSSK